MSNEQLEAERIMNDFPYFVEHIYPLSWNKPKKAPHLIKWAKRIQKNKRTATLSARKHLKSTLMYAYLMWRIYRCIGYDESWLYMSYTSPLSAYHTNQIKRCIERNPFFSHIKDLSNSESILKYTVDGENTFTCMPASILRFNRGWHGYGVICDDILCDPTSEMNFATIETVNRTFFEEVLSLPIEGGEVHLVGCVNPKTYIYTDKGIKRIGDLIDYPNKKKLIPFENKIYGKKGLDKTSHFFVNGKVKTKKITLENGYNLECSLNHPLWICKNKRWITKKDSKWIQSKNLKEGDFVSLIDTHTFGDKPTITINEAYLFGLWTAEGNIETKGRTNRITITNQDKYCISFLKNKFEFNNTDGIHNRKNNKNLVNKMRDYGIKFTTSHFKEIPDKILLEPFKIQKAFLQGLLDGDGSSSYTKNSLQVRLYSSSEELIKTVQIMLLNMGLISSTHKTKARKHKFKDRIINGDKAYMLNLSGYFAQKYINEIGFRIDYKNKKTISKQRQRKIFGFYWKRIKKIEESESYTVDLVVPKNKSFISNGIVSHNTAQHQEDLFFKIKNNKTFDWAMYKAIIDEAKKKVLWPELFTYKRLVELREEELGEKAFSKEYMCMPVWSADAFFNRNQIMKVVDVNLKPEREKSNGNIVAGLDIGKHAHPSHFAVFREMDHKYTMIYEEFFDGIGYFDQVNKINELIELYGIQSIYYDNTRGEFEGFVEQRIIDSRIWKPIVFTVKSKSEMAANFEKMVTTEQIVLLNNPRMIRQILVVNNKLEALETTEGHGDTFWSIALALKKGKTYHPIIVV